MSHMAALGTIVRPNDLVDLEVTDGPSAGRYRTRVEAIGPEHLAVGAPMAGGARVILPVGTAVVIHVLRADPGRGARYTGQSEVRGQQVEGGVALLMLAVPRWQRRQLRSYVRVEAIVPVRWRAVEGGRAKSPWQAGESRDLGGGGLMLVVPSPLPEKLMLQLLISLPDWTVEAVGEVVRMTELHGETGAAGSTALGAALRFVEIAERDRDRIIRFVLRRQAEIHRLGLM